MKSKFTWIITLCLAFFIQFSFAQEKTISGVVTSKTDNMSVPGVNIIVEGTKTSVQTDFDGKYTIKANVGQKLVFSFLGSTTQVVVIGASNEINIQLVDEAVQLQSVVVEGYGVTRTKAKSNVASTTIGAETISARPNASFVQTMQSQIAGVNIATGSGQPGSQSFVVIRGAGSLNGKIEPLYVIDGVPMNSDNFRSINPEEIESVSALLDAGATAIYGNRGANGVIIVKTKRAKFDSPLSINYVSTTGFSTYQGNKYDLMNSQQILTLERTKQSGAGFDGGIAHYELVGGIPTIVYPSGKPMTDAEINSYSTTDWNKEFYRTGTSITHDLSFRNGSKNVASYVDFGYFEQEGILLNTDLQRFNFRSNLDGKSDNNRFTYAANINVNFSKRNEANSVGTGGVNQNYILGANQSVPYIHPDQYINGQTTVDLYNATGSLVYTPLFLVDKLNSFVNSAEEIKGISNFSASYKLTDDLTITENLGIDFTQGTTLQWQSPLALNSIVFQNSPEEGIGFQSESFGRTVAFDNTLSLNYNKSFGKNTINANVYTEYLDNQLKSFGYNQDGLDPKTTSPGAGTGFVEHIPGSVYNVPGASAGLNKVTLLSYFGSVDYDYDTKYGVTATIREDASSRFNDSNKWGTFYSFAGRWNISNEEFMKGSIFQMLKLRASYGTNGNQEITGTTFGALNETRELYTNAAGYGGLPSYQVSQLANPDLKWETIAQTDIGLDFAMFNNRLTGKFDVYNKLTTDLYQDVNISAINALTTIKANYGSLSNKGFEATLAYDIINNSDGFNLNVHGNYSYNQNEVEDIPAANGELKSGNTIIAEGHPIDEFYMVRYIGVNPADGQLLFLDANGNATEAPAADGSDRVYTGKTSTPRYYGGFGFDADYKGFYLTAQFSYAGNVYRLDYDLRGYQDVNSIGTFNKSTDLLNAWTPTNRVTDIPSLFYTNGSLDADSDRYLTDASYTRLRYMSFGYDVPKQFLRKTPFQQVKAFVQGENLYTWSAWRGADAESPRGSDQAQYPTAKTISLGFQLQF